MAHPKPLMAKSSGTDHANAAIESALRTLDELPGNLPVQRTSFKPGDRVYAGDDPSGRYRRADQHFARLATDPVRDQLARSTLLALSSDWAFMVTKDSAAGYARDRHDRHHREARLLADLVERGDNRAAHALALRLRASDGPFGHLDARLLPGGA